MNYKVQGKNISSHNAAKPHSQTSMHVVEYLSSLEQAKNILDLGCGKLRYSSALERISKKICFSDSNVQVTRVQTIKGERCSVLDYVERHYPFGRCVSLENIDSIDEKFEIIFCSNVLSAIPCQETLNYTMSKIYYLLEESGRAIIVNQHRSSYFKKFETGIPHLHGYLHDSRRGTSYYGIICKEVISDLASIHGFKADVWVKDDLTFACLTRDENKSRQQDAA